MSLFFETFLGRVELEWPKEIVCFLEMSTNGSDLVDEVFNVGNTVLSELLLNDHVVGKGDSGSVDLAISSLVYELGDGSLGGIAISNVWFDSSEHVNGSFVQSDEHAVVQLSQSQKLHDLSASGIQLVDTTYKS